jgi:hypothetical protein
MRWPRKGAKNAKSLVFMRLLRGYSIFPACRLCHRLLRILGVQGGRVYDYWHALVSSKARAGELITRNTRHFQGLAENVAWP